MSEKKRESNFELLRIVAALLIFMCHAYQHTPAQSIWWFYFPRGTFNWLGWSGNYCFMLISEWFLSKSTFTWKKWLLLYAEYWFYNVVFGTFTFCLGASSPVALIKCFLPMCAGGNWYMRAYLIFFLFLPFLNKLLSTLTRKEHFWLCVLLFTAGNVLPNIVYVTHAWYSVGDVFAFFTAFFVGSYVRLYSPSFFEKQKGNVAFAVLIFCFFIVWMILVKWTGEIIPIVHKKQRGLYALTGGGMQRVLTFAFGFSLFLVFKNIKMPSIKAINTLGPTTLAVYLIHTQKDFGRAIWYVLAKMVGENPPPSKFFLCAAALAFATFFACAAVDLVRQRLVEPHLAKCADRIDRFVRAKTAAEC